MVVNAIMEQKLKINVYDADTGRRLANVNKKYILRHYQITEQELLECIHYGFCFFDSCHGKVRFEYDTDDVSKLMMDFDFLVNDLVRLSKKYKIRHKVNCDENTRIVSVKPRQADVPYWLNDHEYTGGRR